MKKITLIASLILATTAAVQAQGNPAIAVKRIEKPNAKTLSDGKIIEADGVHQFVIRARQQGDAILNFLITSGKLEVMVKAKNDKIVCTQTCHQKSSALTFEMDENDEYTVSLTAAPNTKYSIVTEQY